jgi:hypothetical protein
MAQQVLVQLVDDLDGTLSEDVSTVVFSLDGVTYEIDLSEDNAERLRSSLAEFVEPARRVGGRLKRGTKASSSSAGSSGEAGQIRAWALENGYEVSNRGRIRSQVVEAYKQAQADAMKPKAAPKKTSAGPASARRGRSGARTKRS